MRMPDWLYRLVQRAYLAEKRIRDRESRERADADDQALRDWADRMRDAHDAGSCGGQASGCPYVPCVPLVEMR